MTTPWKIFACILGVAVVAAVMMGNASHAHRGPAAVTVGETSAEFPKGPTGPMSAPPVDKVPPPSTTPAPQSSVTSIPLPSSPARTESSSSSSTSTTPSSTPAAPSGLSQHYGVVEAPSETQPSGSDSDVSQAQAPVETAAQRVGRRLRGR